MTRPRRPRARLAVPVVLLPVCAALLTGCGDDDAEPSSAPTTSETSTGTSTEAPGDESSPSGTTSEGPAGTTTPDDTADPTGTAPADPSPGTAGGADLCTAMSDALDALSASELPATEDEPLAPELVAVFRQWGDDLATAEVPADFDAGQRAGLEVMVGLLRAVPDDATGRDVDALEEDLTPAEERQVDSVTDWVDDNCDLEVF